MPKKSAKKRGKKGRKPKAAGGGEPRATANDTPADEGEPCAGGTSKVAATAPAPLGTDDPYCTVCLQQISVMEATTLAQCKHIFHSECIESWIQFCATAGNPQTCPTCRGLVKPAEQAAAWVRPQRNHGQGAWALRGTRGPSSASVPPWRCLMRP